MLRAIELFSAAGGLAGGFREAGIAFSMVFDQSPDACASYEANLGQRPVQMDVRDLLRMLDLGWSPGPVDLLVADPPCAPWSRAGKRGGLEDGRDMLVVTVEVVRRLRPRAWLIGNVPGLQDAPNWPVVQRYIGGLAREGYCVRDYACLDAADYGVPQRRLRPYWYGHLAGPCLAWPVPTHGDPAGLGLGNLSLLAEAELQPWVTCRQALGHLPVEELGRPVRLKHEGKRPNPRHPPSEIDRPAQTVLAGDGGGARRALRTQPLMGARTGDPDRPAATLPAKASRVGAGAGLVLDYTGDVRPKRDPSTRGPQSQRVGHADSPACALDARVARPGSGANGTLVWPWDRPATAIFAGLDRLSPPERSGSHGEPQSANAIVLSERAAAILQGFPDGWVFAGATKKARWAQIGQAVPQVLAAAIGRSVLRQFGERA